MAASPALAGLHGRVVDFAHALREAGVPVAVSDDLDAVRAATAIDLLDRAQLREALAATMTKSAAQRPAFDTLFDIYFPARLGASGAAAIAAGEEQGPASAPPARDIGDFLAELVARIMDGDDAAVRRLAREAVEAYGRVESRDGTAGYFSFRVFRHFNLAGILRRLMAESGAEEGDRLAARLARDEFEQRLRRLREEIEAEIRRRLVEQRGTEAVARTAVRPLPEDVDFFRVTADEQAAMRRAVHPLARKLATRLARKRKRARAGRFDVRRTLRASLATGGVPAAPVFRAKHVHRPELVVLCDVSGSVAAFARFTLLLAHSLQGQFSRVRSFAFIDTVDEVTDLFATGDPTEAMTNLAANANLVRLDGHSDYGHAFERFLAVHGDAVTPRSTVLVLGDARNNYRAANAWALAEVHRRARRVYWLNPEPAVSWDSGDSVAGTYARHCDRMVECRTLRQLAQFVEDIA